MKKLFTWPVAIIVMGFCVFMFADTKPAFAGDKLKIGGDMRMRIEQDDDSKKDDQRSRYRVRLRIKGKYKANDTVTVGFRLATGTGSIHSPHQTLALGDGGGSSTDFGLDRAYIKLSLGDFYVWGGKNRLNIWNPASFQWDDDIQPEGFAAGYKGKLGDMKLAIGLGYYVINEAGWGTDDTLLTYQAAVTAGDSWKVKAAVGAMTLSDDNEVNTGWQTGDGADNTGRIAGGSYTIAHAAIEVKGAGLSFKPRLGFAYASSDAEDYWGQSVDATTGATSGALLDTSEDDTTMFVAYARMNIAKVDLRIYYWDNGYAAQPGFGMLAQDDFPFSSNFTGYRFQVGYKLWGAVSTDFRIYQQETKNEDIKVTDNSNAMSGIRDRTRYQLNFNVKF